MRLKRLLVGSLLFLSACKPPTTAEHLDAVLSWIATAGMASEAWLRHTTPDTYTRQTLELSHDTLLQIAGELRKTRSPAIDAALLDSTLSRSSVRIAEMARLVEARNSAGVASQLDSLRADEQVVKRLSDIADSRQ